MIIYPAIDLRDGKCVRLYQGNYDAETIYSDDPINVAKQYLSAGAEWIHVVDLDGASQAEKNQSILVNQLLTLTGVKIQIGGGIRSKSQIQSLLDSGASRIILGSLAVKEPDSVFEWLKYFGPEKIMLALDVVINKDNVAHVAIDAWRKVTEISIFDLIEFYLRVGLKHILCTNISLDGTLDGPDYALYERLLERFPSLLLQASGGICSLENIRKLREMNVSGAIIGRALYENQLTLSEVLSC